MRTCLPAFLLLLLVSAFLKVRADTPATRPTWAQVSTAFLPPKEYAGQLADLRSPLLFEDGTPVRTPADWTRRRQEILTYWHRVMGNWPAIIVRPSIDYLEKSEREGFTQHKIRVEVSKGQKLPGYLLVPPGPGPFPAVFVPFYEAETSVGLNPKSKLRDFAYQLTRRGFVTLSIGSPGGDARKPDTDGNPLQPLSYLAYVAANGYQALASLPYVDGRRVGIVGHSYGGKWAMFGSCLCEKYAAAAWSDGGVVWDEKRANVNYWDPWYLGREAGPVQRNPGLITADNPRTGAYKELVAAGHDLHEIHALMAPRPFLVSGGSEDTAARWPSLNHAVAVNQLLGQEGRVGLTTRPSHEPTPESNEAIYQFFEHFLSSQSRDRKGAKD